MHICEWAQQLFNRIYQEQAADFVAQFNGSEVDLKNLIDDRNANFNNPDLLDVLLQSVKFYCNCKIILNNEFNVVTYNKSKTLLPIFIKRTEDRTFISLHYEQENPDSYSKP